MGRLLHAAGVYILLLYNLYSSFQDFVDSTLICNKRLDERVVSGPQPHRKENSRTTVLNQRPPLRSESRPMSSLTIPRQDIPQAKPFGSPNDNVDSPRVWEDCQDRSSSLMGLPILNALSPSSSTFDFSTTRASTPVVRPDSPILAGSCYVQGTQQVATDMPSTQFDGVESTAFGLDMPKDSDSERSLSSLDQIFRHRDEVNKRIAALRELSPPCSVLYGGFSVLDPLQMDIPASTTPSNNSILSLSVFPVPPSNLQGFFHNISRSSFLSTETLQPCLLHGELEPMSAQWDVTSFIRSESWIINLVYQPLCIINPLRFDGDRLYEWSSDGDLHVY